MKRQKTSIYLHLATIDKISLDFNYESVIQIQYKLKCPFSKKEASLNENF